MKNLKKIVLASALGMAVSVQSAVAQIAPPPAQGFSSLLGDSTAGAETGIFEYMPMLQTGAGVIVAIALLFVGITIVRKVIRKSN